MNDEDGLLVKPWRAAFEVKAVIVWYLAAAYQLSFPFYDYMSFPAFLVAILCCILGSINFYDAHKVFERRLFLFESNVSYMKMVDFNNRIDGTTGYIYLGRGWDWSPVQTQWVYDLIRSKVSGYVPPKIYAFIYELFTDRKFNLHSTEYVAGQHEKSIKIIEKKRKKMKDGHKKIDSYSSIEKKSRGLQWIHGMLPPSELLFPEDDAKGNTLITGTTRSGKTVFYRVLTRQFIRKHECLIVIDPKGDKDLLNIMLEAAKDEGRMDDFVFFHPAYPEKSHRIDPFASYQQPSQLASRVEPLIPSSGPNGDSFSKFAWGVMESILSAMDMINIRPSLMSLRAIIEKGPDELVYDCIMVHCEKEKIKDYKLQISAYEKSLPASAKNNQDNSSTKIRAASSFYKEIVKGIKPSPAIDGLLTYYEHNREHAGKMLASLMPILKSLTSGPLAGLLSPDSSDPNDPRPITNFDNIIRQKSICYIGLDSMADKEIANAIGSIYLSDLVASAAVRHTHGGTGDHVVNLLVDEASNVVNSSYIELLNKGSSASFRNFAATQTIPDFEDALGQASTKDKAVGNFNNLISFRVIDDQTKEYVSNRMGPASIRTAQVTQNTNTMGSGDNPLLYNGTYGTRTTDADAPLVDPTILDSIPDLEFIANISAGRVVKGRVPILEARSGSGNLLDEIPWMKEQRELGLTVGGSNV
jgi:conjugal transfer pilus assembly protein TraD